MTDFKPFGKIPRLNREIVVTEKLDGTNALVWVSDDGTTLRAGSRKRWITPESDNFGFAKWVRDNTDELLTLGPGYHYGEWYGSGIQRTYGLPDKRFALFNVSCWSEVRPSCCGVVTEVGRVGTLDRWYIEGVIARLRQEGSFHVPGWMKPEGVVVYHTASGHVYKVLVENDEGHKG